MGVKKPAASGLMGGMVAIETRQIVTALSASFLAWPTW